MSEIRYYADEHISGLVVAGLRRRGVDVLTPHEAQMRSKSDKEQLDFATSLGRTIITKDDDFLRLDGQGIEHQGIVFITTPEITIGMLVRGLILIHQVLDGIDMVDHVEFL